MKREPGFCISSVGYLQAKLDTQTSNDQLHVWTFVTLAGSIPEPHGRGTTLSWEFHSTPNGGLLEAGVLGGTRSESSHLTWPVPSAWQKGESSTAIFRENQLDDRLCPPDTLPLRLSMSPGSSELIHLLLPLFYLLCSSTTLPFISIPSFFISSPCPSSSLSPPTTLNEKRQTLHVWPFLFLESINSPEIPFLLLC